MTHTPRVPNNSRRKDGNLMINNISYDHHEVARMAMTDIPFDDNSRLSHLVKTYRKIFIKEHPEESKRFSWYSDYFRGKIT